MFCFSENINSEIVKYLRINTDFLDYIKENRKTNNEIAEMGTINNYYYKMHDIVFNVILSDSYKNSPQKDTDILASKIVNDIERDLETIKTTVDGNGNYSVLLQSGYYFVLIRSAHLQGHSQTQLSGKILFTVEKIKEGQINNVSKEFR